MPDVTQHHEPHPWAEMTSDEVLDALVYELYGPVSALGGEVDRLSTGAFADDELGELLAQIRERVDDLSRLVVQLKRYNSEHRSSIGPRGEGDGQTPART
jgi:hypothetical protein